MRRRLQPIVVAFFLLAGFFVEFARGETINAHVIHGTTGISLQNIEVAFLAGGQSSLEEIVRKRTDPDGRVSFSGPFVNEEASFVLVPFYQSIPYPTSQLRTGEQKQIILEVFEPNGLRTDLNIEIHHLFIIAGSHSIDITQFVEIENTGSGTYVGHEAGEEHHVTEFLLPTGISNLKSLSGNLKAVTTTQVFDTQPLPPGRSSIAFAFTIDPEIATDPYRHKVLYPTERLVAYMSPETQELQAPFMDTGEVVIHGRTYRRYHMHNLDPGQVVDIFLSFSKPKRWVFKWIATGFAIFTGIIAIAVSRQLTSPTSKKPWTRGAGVKKNPNRNDLESRRKELLTRLVALQSKTTAHDRSLHKELTMEITALYVLLDELS